MNKRQRIRLAKKKRKPHLLLKASLEVINFLLDLLVEAIPGRLGQIAEIIMEILTLFTSG